MNTRNGKIARLPHHIREELNQRLRDGHEASNILPWLNSLPEVQSVIAAHFAGLEVSEQNLSSWRLGGFRDWLVHREAQEFVAAINEDLPQIPEPDTDDPDFRPDSPANNDMHSLMRWLTIQYSAVASCLSSMDDSKEHWKRLRQLGADLMRLRGSDLHLEALRISNERLRLQESNVARQERKERLGALSPAFMALGQHLHHGGSKA